MTLHLTNRFFYHNGGQLIIILLCCLTFTAWRVQRWGSLVEHPQPASSLNRNKLEISRGPTTWPQCICTVWALLSQGFLPPPWIGPSNRQHHPTRRSGSPRAIPNPRVFQTRTDLFFSTHADVLAIFRWQRLTTRKTPLLVSPSPTSYLGSGAPVDGGSLQGSTDPELKGAVVYPPAAKRRFLGVLG